MTSTVWQKARQAARNAPTVIQFLSKRGWLKFQGSTDYLNALWQGRRQDQNFYRTHLVPLFFVGMNQKFVWRENPVVRALIGEVPYLNGGLFKKCDIDDEGGQVVIEDEAFDLIFTRLLNRFNFTVEESTPLDVQVAVDPEMLGKVFEELVTFRHEKGAYYTPRSVVAFMCKEALKGYLGGGDAITALVDRHEARGMDVPTARGLLRQLEEFRCVDPACGSGAYLLGMLQELFALNRLLDTRANTPRDDYHRKLTIIQKNLYGVDREEFAVNIARLRLWLSLVVEYTGDAPEPLPNLDFKIECGDSLLAPDPQGGPTPDMFRQKDIDEFERMKDQFGDPYFPGDKDTLMTEIKTLRKSIAAWAHPQGGVEGFDWKVEFAEIFRTRDALTTIDGAMNFGQSLAEAPRKPGFDAVLANPPYVRHEEIGETKPRILRMYSDVVEGRSDLFCYFYARSLQLLRPGGMHIFVCSNSWLDVGYGGKLQKYLLENGRVLALYDSAVERQFATADINTIISIMQKGQGKAGDVSRFVSLRAPFDEAIADETKRREITRKRSELWEAGLGEPNRRGIRDYAGDKWGGKYLRAPDVYEKIMTRGAGTLVRLGSIADVRFGIKTGANDFFYVRVLSEENGVAHIRCDDGSEHRLPTTVLHPTIVRPGNIVRPFMTDAMADYMLVSLPSVAKEQLSEHEREFVAWGERRGFHQRSTLRARRVWYSLPTRNPGWILTPMARKRRALVGWNEARLQVDHNLFEVIPQDDTDRKLIAGCLISTFTVMEAELLGRANLGLGALKTEGTDIAQFSVLSRAMTSSVERGAIEAAFDALSKRTILMMFDEVRRQDRHDLDDAFLTAVGFSDSAERAEILAELQDTACRLIWRRQAKAANTREARQTYDDWLASGLPFGNVADEDVDDAESAEEE